MFTNQPVEQRTMLLGLTADIMSAYVSKNKIDVENLPDVIRSVYNKLEKLSHTNQQMSYKRPDTLPLAKE